MRQEHLARSMASAYAIAERRVHSIGAYLTLKSVALLIVHVGKEHDIHLASGSDDGHETLLQMSFGLNINRRLIVIRIPIRLPFTCFAEPFRT